MHLFGDEYGGDVVLLLEDLGGVGGEGGGLVGTGEGDNGSWGLKEKSLISCFFLGQRNERLGVEEKTDK